MSVPVIAFFNNKGGVGKTSLVYHLACMLSECRYRVVAADLDPQGNLSAAFLDDDRLEKLHPDDAYPATIYGAIHLLKRGIGDIQSPVLQRISSRLALIPGDMALSEYEDDLSQVWPKCLDRDERAFRVMSSFWRAMQLGADQHHAQVILIDLGPNLGSINRAALIASDYVVIPLSPDLYSLQGLRNLGPTLRQWRKGWTERLDKNPTADLDLRNRPVKSYDKWIARIPHFYREYVLGRSECNVPAVADDEYCFALLKHYRSLMAMSQESRKPMFALKPADGALGAHTYAVKDASSDFRELALEIMRRANIPPTETE